MRGLATRAAAVALIMAFGSNPVVAKQTGPVLMDRYDQCLEEQCRVYVDTMNWERYEFCRQDCERKYPPQ